MNKEFIINKNNIITFLLEGKVTFTLFNKDSKNYISYHIKKDYTGIEQWFVWTGGKRIKKRCIGIIDKDQNLYITKIGLKPEQGKAAKGILYLFEHKENLPDNFIIYRARPCIRCGELLTNPKWIEIGFGPSCYKKISSNKTI